MKRGRPKLHHTPEQRADAHRAASARYHKRFYLTKIMIEFFTDCRLGTKTTSIRGGGPEI